MEKKDLLPFCRYYKGEKESPYQDGMKRLLWSYESNQMVFWLLFFHIFMASLIILNYMDKQFCQSCGMPLSDVNKGTNANGSQNNDFCIYCYKEGRFTQDFSMSQMIEFCLQFTDQINKETGWNLTPVQAKEQMLQYFPQLKRWREKDKRTLAEKATNLLSQCENVTVVSIDEEGYPRPVQMSKIQTRGFNEIWMATSSTSVKVNDFRKNNKAGLCYDHYGDGVSMRGIVEIITNDAIRKEMWQEWFIHHFPGGATDPNYVLLHFTGTEATFWINGEFAHERIC